MSNSKHSGPKWRSGTRPVPIPQNFEAVVEKCRAGLEPWVDGARACGMAESTFRKYADEGREEVERRAAFFEERDRKFDVAFNAWIKDSTITTKRAAAMVGISESAFARWAQKRMRSK